MQVTRDENGTELTEVFEGTTEANIVQQMDMRLNELEGHTLVARKRISSVQARFLKSKTKKQKKANIFQSRLLAR